jgi:hypothetical protein
VYGQHNTTATYGCLGSELYGVVGSSGGYPGALAGNFDGSVYVSYRLGIGISDPLYDLHIKHHQDGETGIFVENLSSHFTSKSAIYLDDEDGGSAGMILYDNSHPGYPGALRLSNTGPGRSIVLTTDSTPRVRVDHEGNVGIGTHYPDAMLHVRDDKDAHLTLMVENHDPGEDSAESIDFADENGSGLAGLIAYDNDYPGYLYSGAMKLYNNRPLGSLVFETNGSMRMRISESGIVAIGTDLPDARLHVASHNRHAIHGTVDSNDDLAYYAVYGENPTQDGYGVYGLSANAGGVAGYNSDSGTLGKLGTILAAVSGYDGGNSQQWAGHFSGSVYVSGNLGVGMNPPSAKLDVADVVRVRGNTWPSADTGKSMELAYNPGSHRGYIQVYDRTTGGLEWGQLFLGGGSVGVGVATDYSEMLDVAGDIECVALHETSDGRFKTDVRDLEGALDAVGRLRGVSFAWNEESADAGATPGERGIGLIAQEVEAVFPELVGEPEGGHRTLDYSKLTAVLIEAVKELREENEALRGRVASLEAAR